MAFIPLVDLFNFCSTDQKCNLKEVEMYDIDGKETEQPKNLAADAFISLTLPGKISSPPGCEEKRNIFGLGYLGRMMYYCGSKRLVRRSKGIFESELNHCHCSLAMAGFKICFPTSESMGLRM